MSFDKSWPFQTFVHALIEAAVPGIPVFAYAPAKAPDRYIRVDGFTTTPTDRYRNNEQARHGLTVHAIDSPDQGTNSLQWVKVIIGEVTVALTDVALDAQSAGLRVEAGQSRFEPRDDKLNDAHSFVRFTAVIS
jgi:hypothetical protein